MSEEKNNSQSLMRELSRAVSGGRPASHRVSHPSHPTNSGQLSRAGDEMPKPAGVVQAAVSHIESEAEADEKKYAVRAPRQPRFGDRHRQKPVIQQIKVLRRTNEGSEEDHARAGKTSGLKIIHFGGLGEIGKNNMTAIQYNDEIILIDGGLGFPRQNMPGIDFSIPNVGYLAGKEHMVRAWFFSHGHLDHIGAVPFIREKVGDPEVYAAPLTKALIIRRMEEFKDKKPLDIDEFKAGDEVSVGRYFKVKAHRINHSVPDDLMFEIKTPVGTIVHAIDYKMDNNPVNDPPADLAELRTIGDNGVLLFMGDSTGAEKDGHSLSESQVTHDLEKLLNEATGLTIVGCFASALNRVQQIITLAEKINKKVVFDGYSMKNNVEIAKGLGYIKIQKGTQISLEEVANYPREKIVAVVTGAQGESNAALMRIANGEHRFIHPIANDTYIFSSSIIPGNESEIQFVKDQLYRNGAKVFNYQQLDVHAGGHGNREDIREAYRLLRPKFLMPIHGQYSMMVNHGTIAQSEGMPKENVIIADNGSITHVEADRWWVDKEKAPADPVYVDGLGVGDIGNVVLRDRQVLSEDGMFVIVSLVDTKTGKVMTSPDIISRGFIYLKDNKELLAQVRKKARFLIEKTHTPGAQNSAYLRDLLRDEIGKFLFQKTQRRPMVLPVIIEV